MNIRVAWWRGSMFSHTLGWRTLKCYLMLAGVHVDTVGFFRRASESMHNNFTIYCGLVMVRCCYYIGLECTILFLSMPTQWVVGRYSHWPTYDFYNKVWWLGQNHPTMFPFWRRTFLRRLCQHFYTATSFIKKYDWLSGHRISPQCFPKFYTTNCPVGISKVSIQSRKIKQRSKHILWRRVSFFLLIAIWPRIVMDLKTVKNNAHTVAVCPIH